MSSQDHVLHNPHQRLRICQMQSGHPQTPNDFCNQSFLARQSQMQHQTLSSRQQVFKQYHKVRVELVQNLILLNVFIHLPIVVTVLRLVLDEVMLRCQPIMLTIVHFQ